MTRGDFTLSKRMLTAAAVLLLGVGVVALVSLWGLRALRLGIEHAGDEFGAIRTLAEVETRLARARGLLASERPSRRALEITLGEARVALNRLHADLRESPLATGSDVEAERGLIDQAREELGILAHRVESWPADTVEPNDPILTTALDRTLAATAKLAARADASMANAERYTRIQFEETIASVVVVVTLVVISSLLVTVWQYRAVVGPLWRLRRGVRFITAGRLDMRLVPDGDRDFAELAADFNRMTDQLETLYRDLEGKVESKSRELVRSERLASVGHLAAGIAHEINNPLGIIAGHAELSLLAQRRTGPGDAKTAAETLESLTVIRDEAFRCKEIIQQLLSLARKSPQSRQRIDLARVAEQVARMVRGHEEARGREIDLDFPLEPPLWVDANAAEMKQVLLNLVVNALQATTPGAGYIDIHGHTDDDARQVVLVVEDNGRGMEPETAEHVFEPFFSQHKGGDSFGLGLSVTHAIVDSHGGRISAYSAGPGRGARFTVRLPAAGDEAPEGVAPASTSRMGPLNSPADDLDD